MKILKNILILIGCLAIVLFVVLYLLGDDTPNDNTNQNKENIEASADDFYGTADNASTANAEVRLLSSEDFKQLVADFSNNKDAYIGNKPCVVDFFAEWCGPCKQLSPIIEQMAQKYAGKVTFYKIDIDQAPEVSNAYGIQSIPTLFFCADGEINSITGAPDESQLDEMIRQLI